MKSNLFLTFILAALAHFAQGQNFNAKVNATGVVEIQQTYFPQAYPYDTVAVSFTFIWPGCAFYVTPIVAMADNYTFANVPAGVQEQGAIVYIDFHYADYAQPLRWNYVVSPKCPAFISPTVPPAPTLQPVVFEVPTSTYHVDWIQPAPAGSMYLAEYNDKMPVDAIPAVLRTVTLAGYVVAEGLPTYLPSGQYFIVCVWEWQGMNFYESEPLTIF